MKKLHEIIFPDLEGTWGEVDLDECVRVFCPGWLTGSNPLIRASTQVDFVELVHNKMNRDFSYGGWQEDRSALWRGHYHDKDKMLHLGVDFNVPARSTVRLPYGGDVVRVIKDEDRNGGWGGRIDFKSRTHPIYFVLGHLDWNSLQHFLGGKPRVWHGWYPEGHPIGVTATTKNNGGWYPHLHLQCVSADVYESYADPTKIDGYAGMNPTLWNQYPNPQMFVSER